MMSTSDFVSLLHEMSIFLQIPSDVSRCIISDWLVVKQLVKLELAFSRGKDRDSYRELLKLHSGIEFDNWQAAECVGVHEWIHNRNIKLVDLKFSESMLDSEGDLLVPIVAEDVECVSFRTRKSVTLKVGLNDFLLSCQNLQTLRFTGINDIETIHCGILSRLSKLSVGPSMIDSSALLSKMSRECTKLTYLNLQAGMTRVDRLADLFQQNPCLVNLSLQTSHSVLNDVMQYCPAICRLYINDMQHPLDMLPIKRLLENRPKMHYVHIFSTYNSFVYSLDPKNQNAKTLTLVQGISLFQDTASLRDVLFTVGSVTHFSYVVTPLVQFQPCILDWLNIHGQALSSLSIEYVAPEHIEGILRLCPRLVKLSVTCMDNICPMLAQHASQVEVLNYSRYAMTFEKATVLLESLTNLKNATVTIKLQEGERQAICLDELSSAVKHVNSLSVNLQKTVGLSIYSTHYMIRNGVREKY